MKCSLNEMVNQPKRSFAELITATICLPVFALNEETLFYGEQNNGVILQEEESTEVEDTLTKERCNCSERYRIK